MRGRRGSEPCVRFLVHAALVPSLVLLAGCVGSPRHAAAEPAASSLMTRSEFIFETAPFPSCHASTIAETEGGLIAAWFGGTEGKDPDVGIWVSRHDGTKWSAPVELAKGLQDDGTKRYPCWNPVLFQAREGP